MYIHMYIHMCIYIYTYVDVETHIYIRTHIHTYIYICIYKTYLFPHTLSHACIHACIHAYRHTYTCVYIYLHTYMYACTKENGWVEQTDPHTHMSNIQVCPELGIHAEPGPSHKGRCVLLGFRVWYYRLQVTCSCGSVNYIQKTVWLFG